MDFYTIISDIAINSSPWLMHSVTAYLTYYHTVGDNFLDLPTIVGILFGVGAETMGIALMSTAASNKAHNEHYSQDEDKVNSPKVAIIFYILYVLAITTANVLVEIAAKMSGLRIATIALFMLLSLPSAWVIAQRRRRQEVRAKYKRTPATPMLDLSKFFGSNGKSPAKSSKPKKMPAIYQQNGSWFADCPKCDWQNNYPKERSAQMALNAHSGRVHK